MKLTRYDLSSMMKDFPNIELSYEKNIHNKVPCSNIYLSIPKGKKYTFGQIPALKKYKMDHRFKAFKKIKKFL